MKWRHVNDFTHVRLYHFCRPTDINTYLTQGIRLFQHDEQEQKFHELFSDLPQNVRDRAIEASIHRKLPLRVDAAIDDRYMAENAVHYAALGSETIQGMVNWLPERDKHRKRLVATGQAAVIVFEAPVEDLEARAVKELDMYLTLLAEGAYENFSGEGHLTGFCFSFFKTVPPEWITKYEYLDPKKFKRD